MDKRMHERVSVDPIEMVFEEIQGEDASYEQIPVYIQEVSFDGIRFVSDIEFAVHETLRFRMPSLTPGSLLEGRVVWKKLQLDRSFQYGLQVIEGDSPEAV
ncbi:PilZ domain-containing protein [Paenibacillus cremeus]|uniref:PilZ domain-containing protein n=1 Tax=Paenibacillus cremeus TaxID=2163881 RepID=A0A559K7L5_9BACL|nr:PilZ domain-containing protein [Paenibacillus cremeus]TVY08073.1 PilZ domain-containing protein [Paenibacillus cremeus]